jgi:hypothetical protein
METYSIEKDITVVCVQASSFPNGIDDAHARLHNILPSLEQRTVYGISYSDGKGGIIYKAAAGQLQEGEAEAYGLETFVIRKGQYMSELLLNFGEDMGRVNSTFQKLLALPDLDPRGYCLELYLNDKDMRCMVPLKK